MDHSPHRSAPDLNDEPQDDARYVRDAVPDGTVMAPGQAFEQTWIVRNSGSTTWGEDYTAAWAGNERMGAPATIPVPAALPGQEVAVTVPFVAPLQPNTYQSTWQLCRPDGQCFGERFWTLITVQGAPQPLPHSQPDVPLLPPGADANLLAVVEAWRRFGPVIREHCQRLEIDLGVGLAVTLVESGGEPFGPDGRLTIRFENHIFYNEWGRDHPDQFAQHFAFDQENRAAGHRWRPDPDGEWQPCHTDQAQEWAIFAFARGLDATAALHAISMGAGQVMGFNHAALGYASVQEMFDDFQTGVEPQIAGMFRFIENNQLVEAMRNRAMEKLALRYNGAQEPHAARMRAFLAAYDALQSGVQETAAETELPFPGSLPIPLPASQRQEIDPELYQAWRAHIEQGFANNQTMFEQLLRGFMNPYWTTVWFYRILFGLGVLSFIVAAIVAITAGNPASVAVLGGITLVSLLTYFFNRPLQALEENLQFITWLGLIYNSYWVRLAYLSDLETIQADLQATTDEAIAKLQELMAHHAARTGQRPGLR